MRNSAIFLVLFGLCIFCIISFCHACDKEYSLLHKDGLYIVEIPINKYTIKPYVSNGLATVDKIAGKSNALVAINSGFFDARNKKTVSFITENGDILANPKDNENLQNNSELKPYMNKILNRGELRLYNCNGKIVPSVENHSASLKQNCELLSSTQAGPILLPDMDLEKEFFVLKKDGKIVRDGAGMTRKTDRSAVAIKGNSIYFIITDESTHLTIYELRAKLKNIGFEQAMGFDGGGSVSLYVKTKDGIFYQDREEKGASRAVKSALIVLPKE